MHNLAFEWCENCEPSEVVRRIEVLVQRFYQAHESGEIMALIALRRTTTSMVLSGEADRLIHNGDTRKIVPTGNSSRKYLAVWLVLQTAHRLLLQDKKVTQREFYYQFKFFRHQRESDEAILGRLNASCVVGVPREYLNIIASAKGCFSGRIFVQEDNNWVDCREVGISGKSITVELLNLQSSQIVSDAAFIIVIEKDGRRHRFDACGKKLTNYMLGIFNRLSEDRFFDIIPCILITGKGFPDIATRAFTRKLQDCLKIPVIGLCDCNPFGLSILLTYKLGSARMAMESSRYVVDIKWLGLRPSSISGLQLPQTVFETISTHDERKIGSLLKSPYIQQNTQYRDEVILWQESKQKLELEALHFASFTQLNQLVLHHIIHGNFI